MGLLAFFLGFYYLGESPQTSLGIVTVTTVGIVGLWAFVWHVIFHKSDAKRQGWETERPDWMFEVGFANLAFGCVGLRSVLAGWGVRAQVVALLGYAIYLFQASILHGYRYFTDEQKSAARLWRFCIPTLLFAGMMTFFAMAAL